MKNATTYYVFRTELLDDEDVGFDKADLAPVVHRKDYDELRDLTLKLATSTQQLITMYDRRDELLGKLRAVIAQPERASGTPRGKP